MRRKLLLLIPVASLFTLLFTIPVHAGCPFGPLDPIRLPNVIWSLQDSVTACPAGDSVLAGHPARLRITVKYLDECDSPRADVPPESVWVTYANATGNLMVMDKGLKVFADDPTTTLGNTRITIPSFSGCGSVAVTLYVSGVSQGTKYATVRSTDTDATGRTTEDDYAYPNDPCDLDYSGSVTGADRSYASTHTEHWHRQALHGTLVRRTDLCDTCSVNGNNTIGSGDISWSHDGRRIAFSARDTCPDCTTQPNPCRIKLVPSDPAWGSTVRNLSFNGAAGDSDDYDPSWSPFGGVVYFARHDRVFYQKGVPGLNPDTSLVAILGDNTSKTDPQVSPNGDSLAYVKYVGGHFQVFVAPLSGGSARQLTSDSYHHRYVEWSTDGSELIVTRFTDPVSLWKVQVRGSPNPQEYFAPTGEHAQFGGYSPDDQTIVAGVGPNASQPTAHVLDGTGSAASVAIENFPEFTYEGLYPRFSPDGTRLALLAIDPRTAGATLPQVWAARRNMSTPPQITSVGGVSLADSAAAVAFTVNQSGDYTYEVDASDPEDDALTFMAFFLENWMSFDSTQAELHVAPGGTAGNTYDVPLLVATPSGGSDIVIARFFVCPSGGCAAPGRMVTVPEDEARPGPNPARGEFSISTPRVAGAVAQLTIFDLSGRRVAVVRGQPGTRLVWNGRDRSGARVPNGVYLYRLQVGARQSAGKVTLVR